MTVSGLLLPLLPNPLYLGLFYQDPDALNDPLTVELIDSAYTRHTMNWVQVGNVLEYTGSITFTGIRAGTRVVAMGLFDRPVNGRLLISRLFNGAYHFTKGGTLVFTDFSLWLPS